MGSSLLACVKVNFDAAIKEEKTCIAIVGQKRMKKVIFVWMDLIVEQNPLKDEACEALLAIPNIGSTHFRTTHPNPGHWIIAALIFEARSLTLLFFQMVYQSYFQFSNNLILLSTILLPNKLKFVKFNIPTSSILSFSSSSSSSSAHTENPLELRNTYGTLNSQNFDPFQIKMFISRGPLQTPCRH